MSYVEVRAYRFRCDGPPLLHHSSIVCANTSEPVQGENLRDAALWCGVLYGWRIVMGNETPLVTYCPDHKHLWSDDG